MLFTSMSCYCSARGKVIQTERTSAMCFRPASVDLEKKCPQCGASVKPVDAVCPQCGAAVPTGPAMPGAPGAPKAPGAPGAPQAPRV